jgi:hypothetical protein
VKSRWLDVFADGVSEADLGQRVLESGNYLWHLFSWKLVPCQEGDAARQALEAIPDETVYRFYYENPPTGASRVKPMSKAEALALADRSKEEYPSMHGADWYLVDKNFTWTYAHTHEDSCGPYFYKTKDV